VDQREPIELPVEHISNAPAPERGGPFVFQVQFGGDGIEVQQNPWIQPQPRRPRRFLPLVLFIATCLSTFWAGGSMFMRPKLIPGDPPRVVADLGSFVSEGLKYSVALMTILLAHEMGHFLQAVRYKVPASWPWFIPMPFSPLGTMGAVIFQASGRADRKQMFDIGITGPLAGLVVAIPVTIWGLADSRVVNMDEFGGGLSFGNPLLLEWLAERQFGPLQPNQDVVMTPLLHAGWVGILVTALNLIPIGQLDGGHILYGLIGRRAHRVAILLLWGALFGMWYSGNWSYIMIVILLLTMGARHPPTRDDTVPLGPFRVLLGWLTLAFVVIGFTPDPIRFEDRPLPKVIEDEAEPIFVRSEAILRECVDTVDRPVLF
jgi:membrane-associated protease RseP (regulator of RpoE activity)